MDYMVQDDMVQVISHQFDGSSAVSILGCFQNQTGQSPGQLGLISQLTLL